MTIPETIPGSVILPEKIEFMKQDSAIDNGRNLLHCLGEMDSTFDTDFSVLRVSPWKPSYIMVNQVLKMFRG